MCIVYTPRDNRWKFALGFIWYNTFIITMPVLNKPINENEMYVQSSMRTLLLVMPFPHGIQITYTWDWWGKSACSLLSVTMCNFISLTEVPPVYWLFSFSIQIPEFLCSCITVRAAALFVVDTSVKSVICYNKTHFRRHQPQVSLYWEVKATAL